MKISFWGINFCRIFIFMNMLLIRQDKFHQDCHLQKKKKKRKKNFFLTLRLIDANRIKVFITVYSTILNSQGRNLPNRFKK